MSLSRQVRHLFAAVPGDSVEICAAAASANGVYVLVVTSSEESAGQFLVLLPYNRVPRLIVPDPSIDDLEALGVPAAAAAELRAQVAHEEEARSGDAAPEASRPTAAIAETVATSAAAAPATQDDTNEAICAKAVSNVGVLSSRNAPGTNNGVLACAWAVNNVVQQATGSPVGGNLSTDQLYQALRDGRGTQVNDPAPAGAIIISPTAHATHGHVGIVGKDRHVYSNSSRDAMWEQNYTVKTWTDLFQGKEKLQVLFYTVNP